MARHMTAKERVEALRGQCAYHEPAALRRITDPQTLARRMNEGVRPGQLWVAKDEWSRMAYVLVEHVGHDPRVATVTPMSDDPGMAMPRTPVVEAQRSPLGVALAPITALRGEMPVRLLCTPLGDLDDSTMACIARFGPPAEGAQAEDGTWIDDPMSLASYADLADLMDDWRERCTRLPPMPKTPDYDSPFDERDAALYDMLIDVLGLTVPQANEVYDGKRALDERERLALIAAGAHPRELDFTFALPADLLVEVEQPLWRDKVEAFARTHEGDPCLGLARECYTLHARTKGTWRDRLGKLEV